MKAAQEDSGEPLRGRTPIVLVVAVAENGVIGRDNALPWRIRSDMRHFRALTWGKPVVMGRRTFESIPKPLKGRTTIVVSRNQDFAAPGIVVAASLDAALQTAHGDALRRSADAIAIVGGEDIFKRTLPLADRLEVTRVHASPQGDTFFAPVDTSVWKETARQEHQAGPDDEASFTFLTYRRH